MFIDDEVANERLKSTEDLFSRLGIGGRDLQKLPDLLPPSLPDLPLLPVEHETPLSSEVLKALDSISSNGNGSSVIKDLNASRAPGVDISKLVTKTGPINAKRVLDNLLSGYAGRGTKSLHRDVQASIGTTAAILGTTKAARIGDVSIAQSDAYVNGYTGPVDKSLERNHKRDLQDKIIEKSGVVVDIVFDRLLKTLNCMTDDKLEKVTKATELSLVARNLSGIISQATPKEAIVQEQSVHFHVWKPEMAEEDEYPIIEVNSEKEEKVYLEKSIATGA